MRQGNFFLYTTFERTETSCKFTRFLLRNRIPTWITIDCNNNVTYNVVFNLMVQRNITQNYATIMDLHIPNLVENLTVSPLVKKFPVVCNRNFSNIFTTTCHWSLSWASWIPFAHSCPIYFKHVSVLSYYPYLEFQEISFLKVHRLIFCLPLTPFNVHHIFSCLISSAEWKSRSSSLGKIASSQQREHCWYRDHKIVKKASDMQRSCNDFQIWCGKRMQ